MIANSPDSNLNKENLTWDSYIDNCEEISGLNDVEKEAAKDALIYLKSIFGERFLQRIYHPKAKQFPHPLGFYILNRVAYTRFYLTRFAEALRAVQEAKNFNSVFKRFKDTNKFAEGKSVLEVAFEFYHAGFEIEFDPQVFVTDQKHQSREKFPDLRVISKNTGETAIVEVTELRSSKKWIEINDATDYIFHLLFTELTPNRLSIYGELNEKFNANRIDETIQEIRKTIEEVQRTGKFRTLNTDCIEAGIAPKDNENELKKWAQSQGISAGLAGPPLNVDESARAVEKIKSKLLQLPETEPGLIVIPTSASSLFWRYDHESLIDFLSDRISPFTKVYCVVLTYKFFGGEIDNSYATANSDYAFINRNIKGMTEQAIMIFNKTYAGTMSKSLAQQIRRAFLYI